MGHIDQSCELRGTNVDFAFAQYHWSLKTKIEGRTKTKKDLEILQTVAAHVLQISHHTHPWFNLISHTDRLQSMVHGKLNHTCIVTKTKAKNWCREKMGYEYQTVNSDLHWCFSFTLSLCRQCPLPKVGFNVRIYIDVFRSCFRFFLGINVI